MSLRSREKSKQNNVLLELMRMNLLKKNLANDISNCIENSYSNQIKVKTEEWLHLIGHVESQEKLPVLLS